MHTTAKHCVCVHAHKNILHAHTHIACTHTHILHAHTHTHTHTNQFTKYKLQGSIHVCSAMSIVQILLYLQPRHEKVCLT